MKKIDLTKKTVYRFSEDNMENGAIALTNLEMLQSVICVPTKESKVYFAVQGGKTKLLAPNHKAILVNDEIVSVQRKSYKLVTHEEIVMPVIERLSQTSHNWEIDRRHSYVSDTKMRLAITFPDLKMNPDGKSDIAMQLNVSNSYDGSERVKLAWGLLRLICTNGMTRFEAIARSSAKHTQSFNIDNLSESIFKAYESMPEIETRLRLLNQSEFLMTDEARDTIEKSYGKRAIGYVEQEQEQVGIATQWDLMNALTYYVSHFINIKARMKYQNIIAEQFGI